MEANARDRVLTVLNERLQITYNELADDISGYGFKPSQLDETLALLEQDKIEGREEFWVTEMPIKDLVFMLSGRIDRLYMNGKVSNGKSQCIIIDHKYPREPYRSIPHYYAIQLVAYASCIEHSPIYGRRCKVVDAQLVSREKETHRVTSSVDMGESSLESGIRNMPELVKRAWEIKREESAPEHRRFNIVKGEWMECYCKVG